MIAHLLLKEYLIDSGISNMFRRVASVFNVNDNTSMGDFCTGKVESDVARIMCSG